MDRSEEWLPVIGYEKDYEVSNHGRVRSILRKVKGQVGERIAPAFDLKTSTEKNGYPKVSLWLNSRGKTFGVHQLVARAFLGKRPESHKDINHKDGVKTNNHVDNLEWATRVQNMRHAVSLGLSRGKIRVRQP